MLFIISFLCYHVKVLGKESSWIKTFMLQSTLAPNNLSLWEGVAQ